jgi:hypothetical protein
MSSIRVYAPEGSVGLAPRKLAELPPALAGKRILVLDNDKPNAALLMREIAERVAARSGARAVGVISKGNAALPCRPDLIRKVAAEADLVLTGSAD